MCHRTFAAAVVVVAIFSALNRIDARQSENQKKLIVVCSTTQVADFARQIVGDRWEVKCVLGPGQDPHTYQVTTTDALMVSQSDLCLENGWELEGGQWMRKLAKNANKPIATCCEGVQGIEMEYEGKNKKDPHAWFNPANAWIYVSNITDAVIAIDSDNAAEYRARAELYKYQLTALDRWIGRQVSDINANQRLLVTNHDAFGYFCAKYNFRHISPVGWTTGELVDPSVQQRQKVIQSIRDSGVKAIFVETSMDPKMLRQLARESGTAIGGKIYSDAMGPEGSAGETYLGMMRENVLTIVQALK